MCGDDVYVDYFVRPLNFGQEDIWRRLWRRAIRAAHLWYFRSILIAGAPSPHLPFLLWLRFFFLWLTIEAEKW